jgi:hypothetical protein
VRSDKRCTSRKPNAINFSIRFPFSVQTDTFRNVSQNVTQHSFIGVWAKVNNKWLLFENFSLFSKNFAQISENRNSNMFVHLAHPFSFCVLPGKDGCCLKRTRTRERKFSRWMLFLGAPKFSSGRVYTENCFSVCNKTTLWGYSHNQKPAIVVHYIYTVALKRI